MIDIELELKDSISRFNFAVDPEPLEENQRFVERLESLSVPDSLTIKEMMRHELIAILSEQQDPCRRQASVRPPHQDVGLVRHH